MRWQQQQRTWKKEEVARLEELVDGQADWAAVSAELGFTPGQCERKYQFLLATSPDQRQWTVDQEQRLVDAVGAFGSEDDAWEPIAQFVGDGMSPRECRLKQVYFDQFKGGARHLTVKQRVTSNEAFKEFSRTRGPSRMNEWRRATEEEKLALALAGRRHRIQTLLHDAAHTKRPPPKHLRMLI